MREISLSPPGPPHAALRASLSNAELTSDPLLARSAPAPTRRQRSHRPDRYYVGRRPETTEVYVVSGTELEPLAHLNHHSQAAFDWGGLTAGTLELAFAMLAHSTESQPTDLVCRTFRAEVLAGLDRAGFVLSRGDIALWLMTVLLNDDTSQAELPDRPASPGCRAASWIRSRLRRA